MNTKTVTDKTERKKIKRTARKKAAPKAKRAAGVARGSEKKKIRHQAQASASGKKTGVRRKKSESAALLLAPGVNRCDARIQAGTYRLTAISFACRFVLATS